MISRVSLRLAVVVTIGLGSAAGPAAAQPLVRSWNLPGDGTYDKNTNWAPAIVPDGANIEADFLSQKNFIKPITVTLDKSVTLNRMVFQTTATSYTLTPKANEAITLTRFNDNGTLRAPRLEVTKGNLGRHTVAAPIVVDLPNKSNLNVIVAGTSPLPEALTLAGVISSKPNITNGLNKFGAGALVLAAANTYTGDTLIQRGNLVAAVNGALGPGGAGGGVARVSSGATLTLGRIGNLDYNTGQKVELRGLGATDNGAPLGALRSGPAAFVTFNGPITLAADAAVGAPSTGNNLDPQLTLKGVISGGFNLVKVGGGVVELAAANTYTGKTDIRAGVLSVSVDKALSKADTVVGVGATLNLNNVQYQDKAHLVLMGGLGSQDDGQLRAFEGKSSFNGTITLAASSGIGVFPTATVLDLTGTINESAKSGLAKLGPGTLILERGSTYSGGTEVRRGTLFVNNGKVGSATGSGDVTVLPGAALKGNGNIDGKVINKPQANLQPARPNSPGLLAVGGGLTLEAGSTYTWSLGNNIDGRDARALPGIDFSVLALHGGFLSLDPHAVLALDFTDSATAPNLADPFWSMPHEWDILSVDSPSMNPSSTTFTDIANGTFAAGTFSTIRATGLDGYGNDGDILLVFAPVPEPGSWLLLLFGGGMLGLIAWRRRRDRPASR